MESEHKALSIVTCALILGFVAIVLIMSQCSIAVSANKGAACVQQGGRWDPDTALSDGGFCFDQPQAKK